MISRTSPAGRSTASSSSSRLRPALLGVTAALAVAAVVGGVVLIGNDDSDATTASGAPFGMAHVHGLGIDPQDGALLAGT
ncbi:MAG: hypothetical protein LH469_01665, partial [Frankiaceae bacterium]|nr:hypothetical protein [Frankiaceae bacterium]